MGTTGSDAATAALAALVSSRRRVSDRRLLGVFTVHLGCEPRRFYANDHDDDTRAYSSTDVHRALFPSLPKPRTLTELKDGIRRDIKRRRAIR